MQWYRNLPKWARITIPVALVLVVVGAGLLIWNASSDTTSSSDASTTNARLIALAVTRDLSGA